MKQVKQRILALPVTAWMKGQAKYLPNDLDLLPDLSFASNPLEKLHLIKDRFKANADRVTDRSIPNLNKWLRHYNNTDLSVIVLDHCATHFGIESSLDLAQEFLTDSDLTELAQSYDLYRWVTGFKRYIEDKEKFRQEYLEALRRSSIERSSGRTKHNLNVQMLGALAMSGLMHVPETLAATNSHHVEYNHKRGRK